MKRVSCVLFPAGNRRPRSAGKFRFSSAPAYGIIIVQGGARTIEPQYSILGNRLEDEIDFLNKKAKIGSCFGFCGADKKRDSALFMECLK